MLLPLKVQLLTKKIILRVINPFPQQTSYNCNINKNAIFKQLIEKFYPRCSASRVSEEIEDFVRESQHKKYKAENIQSAQNLRVHSTLFPCETNIKES